MRIGIYGGTFNPIHTAHVHLVREFIKRLSLDRVILIPTGTPPHKATHQLASGADRIEMCRLAAADIAECPVTVSDIEVLRTGKSYTADTMTELKAQYPDDELFLLMGGRHVLHCRKVVSPGAHFRRGRDLRRTA